MLRLMPPTVNVPVRPPPLLGATVKARLVTPVPEVGVTVIHGWLIVTTHAHPEGAVTPTVPDPPDAGNSLLLRLGTTWHGAAPWRTIARWPLMTTALSRVMAVGFGVTRKVTCALPWPCVGARSVIHMTSASAVHEHSGGVATAIEATAPLASNGAAGSVTDTGHLFSSGAVTDSMDVEPQAATRRAPARTGVRVRDNRVAMRRGARRRESKRKASLREGIEPERQRLSKGCNNL